MSAQQTLTGNISKFFTHIFHKGIHISKIHSIHPCTVKILHLQLQHIFILTKDSRTFHLYLSFCKDRTCISFAKWFQNRKLFDKFFIDTFKWELHIYGNLFIQILWCDPGFFVNLLTELFQILLRHGETCRHLMPAKF